MRWLITTAEIILLGKLDIDFGEAKADLELQRRYLAFAADLNAACYVGYGPFPKHRQQKLGRRVSPEDKF